MGLIYQSSSDKNRELKAVTDLLKRYNDGFEAWLAEDDEDLERELLYEQKLILYLLEKGKDCNGIIERRLHLMRERGLRPNERSAHL